MNNTAKKTSRNILFVLGICVVVFYQNCAQQNSSRSNTESNNQSPFVGDKVQIASGGFQSPENQNKSVLDADGATVLKKGADLVAIVSESCLRDRKDELGAGVHFIAKYLDDKFYTQANEKFDQLPVHIVLKNDIKLDEVKRLFARDKCMIGLTENQKIDVVTSKATNDPQATQQDYLSQIHYDEGEESVPPSMTSVKVTTAIIDSGYDFSTQDQPSSFSPLLLGTDLSGDVFIPGNDLTDVVGHGTFITSLLAAPENNGVGIRGLVGNQTQVLPIKVVNSAKSSVSYASLFMAIRRAINGGAEVINLSLAGLDQVCPAVLGQAIYYGIERGAFFVIAAGNGLSYDASKNLIPGEIISPREIGPLPSGQFSAPACWGRYFKGAITVASAKSDHSALSAFSNWGAWGVEMAAPGERIASIGLKNKLEVLDGTSFAAAFVTAAAVKAISFHKSKSWNYSPWLIEDILVNAMPSSASLTAKIRNGKYLDWKNFSDYLIGLTTKTALQRLQEPTDDNEAGSGLNIDRIGSNSIQRLEIFTKDSIVWNKTSRIQFQVIAYYTNGSYKVVTREATISSQNTSALNVDASGVGYPQDNYTGSTEVRASYSGFSASTSISLISTNVTSGTASSTPVQLRLTVPNQGGNLISCRLEAIYEDSSIRLISHMASFASSESGLQFFNNDPGGQNCISMGSAFGDRTSTIYGMYRGISTTAQMIFPKEIFDKATLAYSDRQGASLPTSISPSATPFKIPLGGVILLVYNHVVTNTGTTSIYHLQNLKMTSPNCPKLNELLKNPLLGVDTSQLTAGTCDVVLAGEYRGEGTAKAVSQTFKLEFFDDNVVDLALSYNKFYRSAHQTLVTVKGITASGKTITLPTGAIKMDILNSNLATSPFNVVTRDSLSMLTLQINDAKETEKFTLRAKHLSTGVQKDFMVSMEPTAMSCVIPNDMLGDVRPAGYPTVAKTTSYCNNTNRAQSPYAGGVGTEADPYRICTEKQFLDSRGTWNGWVALEDNLDFTSYGNTASLSQKTNMLQLPHFLGNGFEIKNVILVDSERDDLKFFGAGYVSNIKLKNFQIQGRNEVKIFQAMKSADRVHVTDSQIIGTSNVSVMSGMVIKASSVTNTIFKGDFFVGAFAVSRISSSLVDAQLARQGVPGSGVYSGILGVTPQSPGSGGAIVVYDVKVKGTINGVASGAGVIGTFQGCMKNVDAEIDVVSQGDVGGLVGTFTCSDGPYTTACGIENSTFKGSISGQQGVGGIARNIQSGRVKNITLTNNLSATQACGAVAGQITPSSYFTNVSVDSTYNCQTSSSGKVSSILTVLKDLTGKEVKFWPTDLNNTYKFQGTVPTKKYGTSSIGDPL